MKTEVVMWPESQELMDKEGFFENCELINSVRGFNLYGSSAYLVDRKWLEDVRKGLIPDRGDSNNEYDDYELVINYDFPYDNDDE